MAELVDFRAPLRKSGDEGALASEEISIAGESLVRIISTGAGESGDFSAEAASIEVLEQAQIASTTTGSGVGGDIDLWARTAAGDGSIEVLGGGETPEGIRIETTLSTEARGDGPAGAIRLEADSVWVADSGNLLSGARSSATGAGGAIEIRSSDLLVENGAFVASATDGASPGGAVTIEGLDGAAARSSLGVQLA